MEELKNKKLFLLDMDGTIYLGNKLFENVNETIDCMRKRGKVCFLTNNSSKSAGDYYKKLTAMKVKVFPDEIYTSGMATAEYLLERYGKIKLCVIASESYKKELEAYGFEITKGEPDLVLVGFNLQFTYDDIYEACKWIRRGKPYIATHPDVNCPGEEADLPDVGSLIELIATSTGRRPDVICGKPHAPILDGVAKRYNVERNGIVMVGDRLVTDIKFGVLNGIDTVLVMTGETTYEMLEKSEIKPTYVFEHISQFARIL